MKNIFVLVVLISFFSCTKEKEMEVVDEEYGGKDKDGITTIIAGEDKDAMNEAYSIIDTMITPKTTLSDLKKMISVINKIDIVENAWIDGLVLNVKFKKGGVVTWTINNGTKASPVKSVNTISELLKSVSKSTVSGRGRKVLLVNQESNNEIKAGYKEKLDTIRKKFEEKKFTVSLIEGGDFNLNFISTSLKNYDLIFLVSLVDYSDHAHWIYTGKDISDSEGLDYIINNYYSDWINKSVTVGKLPEKREGKTAYYTYIKISEKYITDNYSKNDFNNCFVYSTSGKMFEGASDTEKYSVARAFVDCGASAFAGWKQNQELGVEKGVELFLHLLTSKTVKEVVDVMGGDMEDKDFFEVYPNHKYRINNEPNVFALTTPANDIDNASIYLMLEWKRAIDVNNDEVRYFVKLFEKGDESKVVVETSSKLDWKKGLTTNKFKLRKGLLINKEYSWYVIACDPSGAKRKSPTFSFKTINEMPEIKCVAPAVDTLGVDRNIAFRWLPDKYLIDNDITYKIIISQNEDMSDSFSQSVDIEDNKFEYVKTNLLAEQKYYWQIIAVDETGNEYPGVVWNFTTGTGTNTEPTAPILTSPYNTVTGLPFINVNFVWKKSDDINGDKLTYRVWYKNKKTDTIKTSEEIAKTSFSIELKAGTNYEWGVTVCDGEKQVDSGVSSFTTVENSSPSHPKMIYPRKNEANIGKVVRFKWSTSVDPDGEIPWYKLYVREAGGEMIIEEKKVGHCLYETNILQFDVEYEWWVIAHDNNGGASNKEGEDVPIWKFRLKDLDDLSSVGMIFVEGGEFQMGNKGGDFDEDTHNVLLSDFYIGKYEVTHKDFINFLKSNGGNVEDYIMINNKDCAIDKDLNFKGSRYADTENTPVMLVTYKGAEEYCIWKGNKDGCKYRLPTEAEWEYAARGGRRNKDCKYAGSNNAYNVAWTSSNADNKLHAVGSKNSNELFIYDMSGNVCEWCKDWYSSDYYRYRGIETNPEGPDSGVNKVIRGGSWLDNDKEATVYHRSNSYEKTGGVNLGFRIVREIP